MIDVSEIGDLAAKHLMARLDNKRKSLARMKDEVRHLSAAIERAETDVAEIEKVLGIEPDPFPDCPF